MASRKAILVALLFLIGLEARSWAATPLPKSTQEMMKKLKLSAGLLADVDRELAVPKEWVERAKQEGKVRFTSTEEPEPAKIMTAPFRERYPFIAMEQIQSTRNDRMKVLLAYKQGRVLTDVQDAIGGLLAGFLEANGLVDLRDIPGLKNLPDQAKDPNGLWVGTESGFRCLGYNTKFVRKEDLPRRWEDLPSVAGFKGGNLALGNRPELWMMNLWSAKGEGWSKDFLTRLFTELKPQLRKEGMNALHQLLGAGEFHAFVPAGEDSTHELLLQGAPVGFTCPEPAPRTVRQLSILKGAAHPYSAKIFLNWLLSKEGQIAKIAAKGALPIHKDLMRPEFVPFPDQILGKAVSWPPANEQEIQPKLNEVWNQLWMQRGR
jgi:ABC-type Fe3+ transport system substrate-binding protein